MTWTFGDELRKALRLPCVEKVRFATYEEAVKVAEYRTSPKAPRRAKFLQPYRCEQGCHGFHLTSRPFRNKIAEFPVIGEWQP